jgi:hypothetical protein
LDTRITITLNPGTVRPLRWKTRIGSLLLPWR